ncbi:MAG: hypothetical protein KDA58_14735 [Planctomycetaceae bacterium]|nr:hypothetical protein [Planctomycetaceae bacterium]
MSATSQAPAQQQRFHPDAYRFVFEALHFTQQRLDRLPGNDHDEEEAHITGQELVRGARDLALQRYGLLARTVFLHWGVKSTADFGRIVFELIERGEMRKTERDQLSDFVNVYDFDDALQHDYQIDTSSAFKASA